LPTFAEVELSGPVPALSAPGGHIGIELPSGVKLTVDAGVDAEALARVIAVLTR
jgi:transposase